MELVANGLNSNFLRNYLPSDDEEIDSVIASIAYGTEHDPFLDEVVSAGWRLDIWMRYDHTIPVSVSLLEWMLKNQAKSVFCRLIPDVLHSKVIWWKGYGAYLGSANLTDRAWNSNIEAGLFINQEELLSNRLDIQLDNYFDRLRLLDKSIQLTREVVDHVADMQRKLNVQKFELDASGRRLRSFAVFEGVDFIDDSKANDRAREAFLAEWNETITTMRTIGEEIVEYRPSWVSPDIPVLWQADQFLHAYYYNVVRQGHRYPFEQMHNENHADPWGATKAAMNWWKDLPGPPSGELVTFDQLAPYIRDHLAHDQIDNVTVAQFAEIARATHATKDHISKISLSTFGIQDITSMSLDDRIREYAKWLFPIKNKKGQNVVGLIKWVLYGGNIDEITERLYWAARGEDYSIPHYGLNSLAELVGWALPDKVPPRNGRTSKALRALGFDVRLH